MTLVKLIDLMGEGKHGLLKIAIALALSPFAIAPAQALTFDAATDFSLTNNPNGVWSYGYSSTLGGVFNLYPDKGNISGLDYWRDNTIVSAGVPNVAHNGTTNTVTAIPCCQWLPGQLSWVRLF